MEVAAAIVTVPEQVSVDTAIASVYQNLRLFPH